MIITATITTTASAPSSRSRRGITIVRDTTMTGAGVARMIGTAIVTGRNATTITGATTIDVQPVLKRTMPVAAPEHAVYTYPVEVPPSAIDAQGHVNNVEFVRWMQEASVAHADACGCTAAAMAGVGAMWVVRSHHV